MNHNDKSILIFDGDCIMCNRSVLFLYRLAPDSSLLFTTNSSQIASDIISDYQVKESPDSSIILLHNNSIYTRSAAVLKALKLSGIKGKVISAPLDIFPTIFLDFFYKKIAAKRNRYIEGECPVLPQKLREKII